MFSLWRVFGIWLYFYIMSSVSCKYTRRLWSLPGVPKSQQQYCKRWISLRSTRTNKGVLCFQNVIEFHNTGLNIISFAPIRKERPSLHQFSRNSQTLSNGDYTRFHENRTINVECMDRNFLTPLRKVCCSMHWFSRNP
jgi:hypothetical protein